MGIVCKGVFCSWYSILIVMNIVARKEKLHNVTKIKMCVNQKHRKRQINNNKKGQKNIAIFSVFLDKEKDVLDYIFLITTITHRYTCSHIPIISSLF